MSTIASDATAAAPPLGGFNATLLRHRAAADAAQPPHA